MGRDLMHIGSGLGARARAGTFLTPEEVEEINSNRSIIEGFRETIPILTTEENRREAESSLFHLYKGDLALYV